MTKKLLYITLFLCVSFTCVAQDALYKLLREKSYDKLEGQIAIALKDQPNNFVYLQISAKLLAADGYKNQDLYKSYNQLIRAISLYPQAKPAAQERARKWRVTSSYLKKDLDTVCTRILAIAEQKNTVQAYNDFLTSCPKCSKTTIAKADTLRSALAFAQAQQENTFDSYHTFIVSYPRAKETEQAVLLRDAIAYNTALTSTSPEALKIFIARYPNSELIDSARQRFYKLSFEEVAREGNFKDIEKFIRSNPRNDYSDAAIEKMVEIAKQKNNIYLFRRTVELSKELNVNYNYALYEYYKFFSQDGEYRTLYMFAQQYPRSYLDTLLAKDFKIADKGEGLEYQKPLDSTATPYFEQYITMAAPREKAFVALQKLISTDIANKQWDKALRTVKKFQPAFGAKDPRITGLIEILQRPYDTSIEVQPLPGYVNTREGGEYSPVITANNKYLYFCGNKRIDNLGLEDIFVSEWKNNEWARPAVLQSLSNMNTNEAPLSISVDGTKMLYFREGVIYYSEKTAQGWTQGISVSKDINNAIWSADAMITADGNAIIFASVRKGEGLNFYTAQNASLGLYHGSIHHQSDIYISLKTPQGTWGKPMSLGTAINTIYTDRSPYLHTDMKTLYFSSDGHGGLGNLDVFKSTRLADTCWDCWSTPINLGKEINNSEENWGYRIAPDGETFYFAGRLPSQTNNDIMMIAIPQALKPEAVVYVSGKIATTNNQKLPATIVYEDLSTGERIGTATSDPTDGSFTISLPAGKIYGYYVESEGYYPQAEFIDLTKEKKNQTITHNIQAVSFDEMKRDSIPVRLNNLFFDTNKSTLLPYSLPELKRVAKILQKLQMPVEISGYTDNVGDDNSNMSLSLRRAEAVKEFLIQQGCAETLFTIKGYGETKAIDTNETAAGRAKNRRVELRFL
ncbi:MAG: OmpA family protein [Bacteroidales bacterium]|jgi:outer membrane protein OmpA-like peptidoglycan-associated protein|nr:OmpA family protein [Bacteroidales bacterium]